MPDGSDLEIGEQNPFSEYENYVLLAAQLYKDGKYEDAIDKLRNKDEAKKVGFNISHSNTTLIFRKTPQEEEIDRYAHKIASLSWFHDNTKTLELSGAVPFPGSDAVIPQKLLQETALIHLEEWLHGLQNLRGSNLTNERDHEVDIASYLMEKGIPLTDGFMDRHGRRDALGAQKTP